MIQIDTKMVIKAIEHCKICQCNGCPFKGHGSCCLPVLEYLIKAEYLKNQRGHERIKINNVTD